MAFSYVYKVYFSKIFASGGLRRKFHTKNNSECHSHMVTRQFKKEASCTFRITVSAILICFQGLFFKNFHLQRFKKETSCTLIMTVSAILICLQGLFFKNFGLRRFKKEASFTRRMTLRAILICLQGLIFKIFRLRRFKKEASSTLRMEASYTSSLRPTL